MEDLALQSGMSFVMGPVISSWASGCFASSLYARQRTALNTVLFCCTTGYVKRNNFSNGWASDTENHKDLIPKRIGSGNFPRKLYNANEIPFGLSNPVAKTVNLKVKATGSVKSSSKKAYRSTDIGTDEISHEVPIVDDDVINRVILGPLDTDQIAAVKSEAASILLSAGPGAGKTRTLSHRVAYLICKHKIDPSSLMVLTFTNAAAKELTMRVDALLKECGFGDYLQGHSLWIGTFHSICRRLLTEFKVGSRPIEILDPVRQVEMMSDILNSLKIEEYLRKNHLLSNISRTKMELLSEKGFKLLREDKIFQEVYKEYEKRKKLKFFLSAKHSKELYDPVLFDFDDLLTVTLKALKDNHNGFRDKLRHAFKTVLVDESQDTNKIQYALVNHFTASVFMVGDIDQCIYGFRGADALNMRRASSDFKDLKRLELNRNYRSTEHIVSAANGVIQYNLDRFDKVGVPMNKGGSKVRVVTLSSDFGEADWIAREYQEKRRAGVMWSDMAVLFRTNRQSQPIQHAFAKLKIPYEVIGGFSFYDRTEVKDILAYLRLILNPADNLSFRRIVNAPKRGIADASLKEIFRLASDGKMSAMEMLRAVQKNPELKHESKLSKARWETLLEFSELFTSLRDFAEKNPIDLLIDEIISRTKYDEYLEKKDKDKDAVQSPTDITRMDHLEQLKAEAAAISSLPSIINAEIEQSPLKLLLDEISMVSSHEEETKMDNKVKLMTCHKSKGLEYEIVTVSGCVDGLFPLVYGKPRNLVDEIVQTEGESEESIKEKEQERNLFYVAMTRAKRLLNLTYASERMMQGRIVENFPSPFIHEIPLNHIERDDLSDVYSAEEKPVRASWSGYKNKSKKKTANASTRKQNPLRSGRIRNLQN